MSNPYRERRKKYPPLMYTADFNRTTRVAVIHRHASQAKSIQQLFEDVKARLELSAHHAGEYDMLCLAMNVKSVGDDALAGRIERPKTYDEWVQAIADEANANERAYFSHLNN